MMSPNPMVSSRRVIATKTIAWRPGGRGIGLSRSRRAHQAAEGSRALTDWAWSNSGASASARINRPRTGLMGSLSVIPCAESVLQTSSKHAGVWPVPAAVYPRHGLRENLRPMRLPRLHVAASLSCLVATPPLPASAAQSAGPPLRPPTPREAPPAIAREFRAAWVATVGNIDWPSRPGLSTWDQQQELLAILNRAVALRLNAIILQVRPGTDALYDSRLGPWRECLTRRAAPELVGSYGAYLWMDPGIPEVRRRAERVVLDIVRRYDVDGVHLDDYFYPYKEKDSSGIAIDFPDSTTYARYVRGGGTLARDDWRRHNVDLLIHELYRRIKALKPWVQFGISPISGWRANTPAGARTFDAFGEIYADTRKWLALGWCDYFVPQLYSAIESPTPYPAMLQWWVEQNARGRHLYAGNGLHRVRRAGQDSAGGDRAPGWKADEIVAQVRITRDTPGAQGNVYFSMKGLMQDADSIAEALAVPYAGPALVPASPWLHRTPPPRPSIALKHDAATGEAYLALRPAAGRKAWLWVVQTRSDSGWSTEVLPGDQGVHRLAGNGNPGLVSVTAVDRTGNQSRPAVVELRD